MSHNVEVPTLGESITEAVVTQWLKNEGEHVNVEEPICELESDKATVDLPAPISGILHPAKKAGETARVGEVIARIDEDGAKIAKSESSTRMSTASSPEQAGTGTDEEPVRPEKKSKAPPAESRADDSKSDAQPATSRVGQAGKVIQTRPATSTASQVSSATQAHDGVRREPMSKIRRSIAERMVRAQQTTAMLTTFNEIDMTAIQDLRARHQEQFRKTHGISLGLTSFFAQASVLALKQFPALNAQIEGDEVVYFEHVNLGVAVSTERGLVVPVLHNVESLSLARIEAEIKRSAAAAREGKLSLAELSGGTFTITNGGVFGSLLSTPILNPPQTGILGMHAIQDRPVAIDRQVVIRPMMYVALTYDHRLVDGQQAASFLVRIKQLLEDPMQMIFEI